MEERSKESIFNKGLKMKSFFSQCGSLKGNSLLEYVLPTVIITSVLISGLGAVPFLFQDFMMDTTNATLLGDTLIVRKYGVPVVPQSIRDAAALVPAPAKGDQQVCFESGLCINVPVIGDATIETAGSNGTELLQRLAKVYDQLVLKLKAEGADPSLINMVKKVATEAHTMADVMEMRTTSSLDSMYASYGSSSLPADIYQYNGYLDAVSTGDTKFKIVKGELDAQFASYPNLEAIFEDVKRVVDLESQNINTIYDARRTYFENYAGEQDWGVLEVDSALVHQSANTICGTVGQQSCWYRSSDSPQWKRG